ncbi:Gld1p LALA0_S03e06304g [Lachancea lanzarotensis]|uniref:LALA0S03e06304g1_1 n=1 Tax=Lachancea lanzarotensis TaxID=1245769 RepID=A0A0C7N4S1_9SACH|nr:uncharacterized protein LALA0_S03e06304g [Lachancea lanzarotensis]CEP61591.1 LALA0S03e06304g1_1 [Lachancea lanzarotensis]
MQDSTSSQAVKLQTKNFQEDLVEKMRLLTISIIVIHYLKFGSSTAAFLFRLFVHSLLSKSQVVSDQFRRVSLRVHNVRRIPGLSSGNSHQPSTNETNPNPPMPGTFAVPSSTETSSGSIEELSEAEIEVSVNETQRRVKWVLFHFAFTFNCISIIMALIWPIDFISKAGHYGSESSGSSFGNIPSPFANQNGLIGGELRSGLFVQLVGEQLPSSNFWSNLNIVLLEFLILSLQFGQYILTAYNFADPPFESPNAERNGTNYNTDGPVDKDDAYNGIVLVTTIEPVEVLNDLLDRRYERTTTAPPTGADLV